MDSGWVHIFSLPVPYPYYEIGENLNPYANPDKSEKTRQIAIGLDGTHGYGFCCHAYPNTIKK